MLMCSTEQIQLCWRYKSTREANELYRPSIEYCVRLCRYCLWKKSTTFAGVFLKSSENCSYVGYFRELFFHLFIDEVGLLLRDFNLSNISSMAFKKVHYHWIELNFHSFIVLVETHAASSSFEVVSIERRILFSSDAQS